MFVKYLSSKGFSNFDTRHQFGFIILYGQFKDDRRTHLGSQLCADQQLITESYGTQLKLMHVYFYAVDIIKSMLIYTKNIRVLDVALK